MYFQLLADGGLEIWATRQATQAKQYNQVKLLLNTRQALFHWLREHLDPKRGQMLDTDLGKLDCEPCRMWISLAKRIQNMPVSRSNIEDAQIFYADV